MVEHKVNALFSCLWHVVDRWIFQVLLEAGQGFVKIVAGEDLQSTGQGTCVSMDRAKIMSVGYPAIRDFLLKLQLYKSTGG